MTNKEIVLRIIDELNILEAEHLRKEGYTNLAFFDEKGDLTKEYKIHMKEKRKYFNIDFGTSGAFMVDKETGEIYNIKGYGQPDFKKKLKSDLGNIKNCIPKELHKRRFNYLR